MKRYEQFNQIEDKTNCPEDQAFGMMATDMINEIFSGEERDEMIHNYTRKFREAINWLNEEVSE